MGKHFASKILLEGESVGKFSRETPVASEMTAFLHALQQDNGV